MAGSRQPAGSSRLYPWRLGTQGSAPSGSAAHVPLVAGVIQDVAGPVDVPVLVSLQPEVAWGCGGPPGAPHPHRAGARTQVLTDRAGGRGLQGCLPGWVLYIPRVSNQKALTKPIPLSNCCGPQCLGAGRVYGSPPELS